MIMEIVGQAELISHEHERFVRVSPEFWLYDQGGLFGAWHKLSQHDMDLICELEAAYQACTHAPSPSL